MLAAITDCTFQNQFQSAGGAFYIISENAVKLMQILLITVRGVAIYASNIYDEDSSYNYNPRLRTWTLYTIVGR